jgi:putative membrane protein
MKRILVILSTAFFLVGCTTDQGTSTGGTGSSDVAIGSGSHSVAAADSTFAREACQAGAAEVELGKLAARNTRNREVRALARKISEDHARAEKELGQLFARKGLPPEKELAPDLRMSLDRLASLTGREFDQAFKEQVIKDHEKTIELFEKQSEQGTDPDLKAFAQKHLPHLREHLAMAQRLEIASDSRSGAEPTAVDVLGNPATRTPTVPR